MTKGRLLHSRKVSQGAFIPSPAGREWFDHLGQHHVQYHEQAATGRMRRKGGKHGDEWTCESRLNSFMR
jgi:hypothetical protein